MFYQSRQFFASPIEEKQKFKIQENVRPSAMVAQAESDESIE
jgi:isopenicillin N synthase-like dioxygenase